MLIKFIKNWTLPISMISGVLAYFIYVNIPFLDGTHSFANRAVAVIQPLLLFCMLFLTFCKISFKELRPQRWHLWLLLIQVTLFGVLSLILVLFPTLDSRVIIESAMLCLICPTATAAPVITSKLGGNAASLTTYTVMINLVVAIVAPLLMPLAHPHEGLTFLPAFFTIIRKVFPLLIFPMIVAWIVRQYFPAFHKICISTKDLSFYLWAIALALALTVSTRAIVHSELSIWYEIGIAVVSMICCLFQFGFGRKVGNHYNERITGGQALGQKNTILIIWMGYTFLSPITALAGGFYSIWHNVINSYQLYEQRKNEAMKN